MKAPVQIRVHHRTIRQCSCSSHSNGFPSQRASKKAEKDEKSERLKVKKAIEKNNMEGARIYGQVMSALPISCGAVLSVHRHHDGQITCRG